MNQNIIQAESFFIPSTHNAGEFLSNITSRLSDGADIKKVFRFFDRENYISSLITQLENVQGRIKKMKKPMLFFKEKRISYRRQQINCLEQELLKTVIETVDTLLQTGEIVAIEGNRFLFRCVEDNERHEFAEAIRRTSGVWLFTFQPNDLLSEENEFALDTEMIRLYRR